MKEQDLRKSSSQVNQFDTEWLHNSYNNFKIGIVRYAIPLTLLCSINDYFFSKENYFIGLAVRCCVFPLFYISIQLLKKSKSKAEFVLFYLLTLAGYSAIQTSLIYLFSSFNQIYFLGILSVSVGAFSLINLPTYGFYIGNVILFSPYFILSIFNGFIFKFPLVFSAYYFTSFTIVVIFDYLRRLNTNYLLKEFNLRQSLHLLIEERERAVVTLANEITERNIREQSRENEYNRNLELNQLAQQVAHDIRSPLTALNVAAQKIKDTSADVSEIIKHTSDRINGLADSLLAKFANKNVQITSIAIANLSQILPKVIEEKTLALEKIHKKIHISPPPTTNAEVQINDIDLSRIVSNIIDNAIDSIRKKGEIRITVDEAPDAQAVTLKVRDTGAGIPKEILPNIGQYGFSYGKTNGSGIGLAHAIKILNATGGSLKISSEPNNGTEVSITLKKVQMSGNGLDAP